MRVGLAIAVAVDFRCLWLRLSGWSLQLKTFRVIRQRSFVILYILVRMLVIIPVERKIIRILGVLESV